MSDPFMPIDFRHIGTGQAGQAGNEARKTEKVSSADSNAHSTESKSGNALLDSVELSGKVSLVNSLIEELASRPVVNESRVEQLRTSIASGEFTVSADKIATKIIALDDGLRNLIE